MTFIEDKMWPSFTPIFVRLNWTKKHCWHQGLLIEGKKRTNAVYFASLFCCKKPLRRKDTIIQELTVSNCRLRNEITFCLPSCLSPSRLFTLPKSHHFLAVCWFWLMDKQVLLWSARLKRLSPLPKKKKIHIANKIFI